MYVQYIRRFELSDCVHVSATHYSVDWYYGVFNILPLSYPCSLQLLYNISRYLYCAIVSMFHHWML